MQYVRRVLQNPRRVLGCRSPKNTLASFIATVVMLRSQPVDLRAQLIGESSEAHRTALGLRPNPHHYALRTRRLTGWACLGPNIRISHL